MQFHCHDAHTVALANGALVTALLDHLVAHNMMPPRQARAVIRNAANNLGGYATEDAAKQAPLSCCKCSLGIPIASLRKIEQRLIHDRPPRSPLQRRRQSPATLLKNARWPNGPLSPSCGNADPDGIHKLEGQVTARASISATRAGVAVEMGRPSRAP
jgi:hypothetical protein